MSPDASPGTLGESPTVKIETSDVQRLAELVKLELSEGDAEGYREDLDKVLDSFENLAAIDTSDIPATARIFEGYAELEDDVPGPSLERDDLRGMAGDTFDDDKAVFRFQGVFSSTDR